ncbi:hypothetical protein ABLN73_18355 [Mycobacterium tuberculosis]
MKRFRVFRAPLHQPNARGDIKQRRGVRLSSLSRTLEETSNSDEAFGSVSRCSAYRV